MSTVPSSRPPLSICLVNFNGAGKLPQTLAALQAAAAAGDEILVVDNGSTDSSLAVAATCCPRATILRLGINRGPGAARNRGFARAAHLRILFVDNDVLLEPDCPTLLAAALEREPRAAAAMARLVHAHRPATVQFDGAECHYTGLMGLRHAERPLATAPAAPFSSRSLVTACFMLRRDRWSGGTLFDEDFFFNYEDHDLGVRLMLGGQTILSVPAARARHLEGTPGLSMRPGGRYHPLRVFCLIRNRWLILIKNFQGRTLAAAAPVLLLFEIAQLAVVLRKGWGRQWRAAAAWILVHWSGLIAERRRQQARRKVADRAFLTGGGLPLRPELTRGRREAAALKILDRLVAGYGRWLGYPDPGR